MMRALTYGEGDTELIFRIIRGRSGKKWNPIGCVRVGLQKRESSVYMDEEDGQKGLCSLLRYIRTPFGRQTHGKLIYKCDNIILVIEKHSDESVLFAACTEPDAKTMKYSVTLNPDQVMELCMCLEYIIPRLSLGIYDAE